MMGSKFGLNRVMVEKLYLMLLCQMHLRDINGLSRRNALALKQAHLFTMQLEHPDECRVIKGLVVCYSLGYGNSYNTA